MHKNTLSILLIISECVWSCWLLNLIYHFDHIMWKVSIFGVPWLLLPKSISVILLPEVIDQSSIKNRSPWTLGLVYVYNTKDKLKMTNIIMTFE